MDNPIPFQGVIVLSQEDINELAKMYITTTINTKAQGLFIEDKILVPLSHDPEERSQSSFSVPLYTINWSRCRFDAGRSSKELVVRA